MSAKDKLTQLILLTIIYGTCLTYTLIHQNKSRQNQSRSELALLNNFLSTFLEQDKTLFDLKMGNFRNISENIGTSLDPFSECVLFYSDISEPYSDSYGICGKHRDLPPRKMGWDLQKQSILLSKPFGTRGAVVLYRSNPDQLVFRDDQFYTVIRFIHIKEALLSASMPALSLYILTWIFLNLLEKSRSTEFLRRENKIKSRQLHDATNLATGMAVHGYKLLNKPECQEIGQLLIAASTLSALCTAPEKPMPLTTHVDEFCQILIKGYFFNSGDSHDDYLELGDIYKGVIRVSQTDLMRALKNLLENALRCSAQKKIYFHAKKTDQGVEFLFRNKGFIKDPDLIFSPSYSGRGSTGQGMSIIEKSLKNCGSTLNLSQNQGYVTFSFVIQSS